MIARLKLFISIGIRNWHNNSTNSIRSRFKEIVIEGQSKGGIRIMIEREGMIRAQDRDRNRERETENNPSKLGRELVSSATRVSQPASIRLEFVPFTVCYNLSIPSLPSFAPLYPCLNSPIPDQAYAPSSCHSIYQSALLQSFSSSLPILLHIAFSFVCSTL